MRCVTSRLLFVLPLLLLPPLLGGCDGGGDGGGEGEGEGLPDGGLADGEVPDGGAADQGTPDSGVDEWAGKAKLKDGIGPKDWAPASPSHTVVFSRPRADGASRGLCYWRGTAPASNDDAVKCLNLPVGNPSNPMLSADGEWLTFYEAGGTSLQLVQLTDPPQLTTLKTASVALPVRNSVVSSGGRFVAFQQVVEGVTQLIRLDRTLTPAEEQVIWDQEGDTGTPSLSDDGATLVFSSNPLGTHDIYRWSAALRDTADLTPTAALHEKDPRVSANGDVICLRQAPTAEAVVGQVAVLSDGRSRNITTGYDVDWLNNHDCQVSSTGRHVVFRSLPGNVQRTAWLNGGGFYVYDLNADSHRTLPDPTTVDKSKPFSPWRLSSDGRWIVFSGTPIGGRNGADLWVLDVASGRTEPLFPSSEAEGTGAPAIN